MYYFIFEGRRGKADYTFIKSIINEFNNGELFGEFFNNGNSGILELTSDVIKSASCGDTVILFFDKVTQIINRDGSLSNVYTKLKALVLESRSKGVCFRCTEYYCLEEYFLTYKELLNLVCCDINVLNLLAKLRIAIMNSDTCVLDLYYKLSSRLHLSVGDDPTRETLAYIVLNNLVKNTGMRFGFDKSRLGECWYKDCAKSGLHINICNNCKYRLKNRTFREKLEDMDNNSVSVLSAPFSTLYESWF